MSHLSRQAREALELVSEVCEPSPAVRLRGRQRLHAAIATGAVTTTVAEAEAAVLAQSVVALPTVSLLASLAGSFAIGLAVGVGGIAATHVARVMREAEAPRLAATVSQGGAAIPAPAPRLRSPTAVATEPLRGAAAPLPRSAPRGSLAVETAYIEKAQLELQGGEAGAALVTLSAYFAEHPRGVLAEEARAAQVVALCASGRRGEGQLRALEFERMNPTSVLVPRVRQACHVD